ncbi:hypothetical protein O6H91_08G062400 [Diphasiastrum complanatum]|uniref:Uncharacterized protein n=1 Tax=Diphasiastrum complanatum TaxID=34168 RepID=A0ACC2CY57_DIPCM|nr:hypothetical protein O6H91_08G062400 [Diphasiastrum complanatum]
MLRCRTGLFSAAIFSFIEMKLPLYDRGSVEEERWILNKGSQNKLPNFFNTFRDFNHAADEPDACTADELHCVPVPGTTWQLALWRYCPPADVSLRKHPLLLLPAIGTKANCFDLDPRVSLARYMSEQGFDTWILEARGCGASKRGNDSVTTYTGKKGMDQDGSDGLQKPDSDSRDRPLVVFKSSEPVEDYDWDFDTYLQEEIPTAIEYIRNHMQPEDCKLLSIGHSLGGIFLYGRLATHGENSGLAGVVTIASALEYGVSNSSLKLLLPFKDVVGTFHGHVVPLDALMTIMYPLVVHPPYVFAWLGSHISFGNNMDPDLYKKLLLTSFCPIPVKLLLQLSTVFQRGGLRNCEGSIVYKELLQDCEVPVLAIAADKDLICPPPAVLDTVKALPCGKANFKQFGDDDHHYGHYDILCSDSAREEVFPVIVDFLVKCDRLPDQKHSPKLHDMSKLQDSN